jgi:hypothetical protein
LPWFLPIFRPDVACLEEKLPCPVLVAALTAVRVNKTGPSGLPNQIAQFPQLQTGAFGSSSFHVAHKMLLFTNPMNIKHIEKEFSKNLMPYMRKGGNEKFV